MAEIKRTQAELDEIFKRLEKDYGKLTERQQAFAIREIGRVRSEMAELLADFADDEGVIKRQRMSRLLRELDEIERSLRNSGEIAFERIIEESSEWTVRNTNRAIGVTISTAAFDRINEHVVKYVVKRFGEDGLVLSDRIWGLSGEIRDELATVIRRGILRGDGINAMIPQIRQVYDNETWKIRRLARNESVAAHRAATSYNAQESNVVEWVKFNHGVKRTDTCVSLANEDRYGKGRGIFKPTDTEIWMPHVQCTGYVSYVLDERWL